MVNAPYDKGQDWDLIVNKVRKSVIKKISRNLKVDISKDIITEEILTPLIIQSKTKSHLGALYGPSSNKRLSAFFRHSNFSSDVKNLFFCGGSVHPGGGIPICLLSAKITAELINNIDK
jgi:phytoene dehydrogenase-like protein